MRRRMKKPAPQQNSTPIISISLSERETEAGSCEYDGRYGIGDEQRLEILRSSILLPQSVTVVPHLCNSIKYYTYVAENVFSIIS